MAYHWKNLNRFLNNVPEMWPKAAKLVARQRPFVDLHNLTFAFTNYLQNLSVQDKVAVLKSFSDLTHEQHSVDSAIEQMETGLNQLTEKQKTELIQSCTAYATKFGFPFVICVRQNEKNCTNSRWHP